MSYTRRVGTQSRTRLQVDERREQLLSLALELFRERTYDEISIDEIAKAAGVSKGLLYHYFKSKRAFYVAAVRHAADELTMETDPSEFGELPDSLGMREGLKKFFLYVGERGKAYSFLMRGGIGNDAEVREIIDKTRKIFLERTLRGLGASPKNKKPNFYSEGGSVSSKRSVWSGLSKSRCRSTSSVMSCQNCRQRC